MTRGVLTGSCYGVAVAVTVLCLRWHGVAARRVGCFGGAARPGPHSPAVSSHHDVTPSQLTRRPPPAPLTGLLQPSVSVTPPPPARPPCPSSPLPAAPPIREAGAEALQCPSPAAAAPAALSVMSCERRTIPLCSDNDLVRAIAKSGIRTNLYLTCIGWLRYGST